MPGRRRPTSNIVRFSAYLIRRRLRDVEPLEYFTNLTDTAREAFVPTFTAYHCGILILVVQR
jgi:hypothetical protein